MPTLAYRPMHIGRIALLFMSIVLTMPCAAAEPQPIHHFTKQPELEGVAISPSGQRLALLSPGASGFKRLAVMELDPVGQPRIVAGFGDADITRVRWVNDNRLVFEAFERGYEIKEGGGGTFAVNHDGSDQRQLIAWRYFTDTAGQAAMRTRILPYEWTLRSTIDDGSNDVFVQREVKDALGHLGYVQLARLDTVTRTLRNLTIGAPEGVRSWLLDRQGEPRVVTAYNKGRNTVYWRDNDQWKPIADFDALKDKGYVPWLIDNKGSIVVTTRSFSDTSALHQLDMTSKQVDPEPLVRVTGFDLNPISEFDSRAGRLMGLHFRTDRRVTHWFDETFQRLQNGIDAALPNRSNRLFCGRCESTRFLVVHSISDRQPGEYYLFDRKTSALQLIGASRPWIAEGAQGRRTFHRVATRDGLPMPVYVTHPAGASVDTPLPAVVLVHGGPWIRGTDLGWHAEAQFLASRGYRVIEPEFRSSQGYGWRHFRAGWKQWGLTIQDDFIDAVQWATANKLVDASRVCIMGAGFGGYAALMGPIAQPQAYRCAISFAGVTDIDLMFTATWSDISPESRLYSYPTLIGDPKTEAEQLARQSPLQRAAEIKVPVLLAHGGHDVRVPVVHADRFVRAARAGGVDIEFINYVDEGHGWLTEANRVDFYGKVERMLEKALKPRP